LGDHLDVDVAVGEGSEHSTGDTDLERRKRRGTAVPGQSRPLETEEDMVEREQTMFWRRPTSERMTISRRTVT
jgi:hypothetical protein